MNTFFTCYMHCGAFLRNRSAGTILPLLSFFLFSSLPCILFAQQSGDLWLMKGHDTRRTGQSGNRGPVTVDAGSSWGVQVPAAHVINVGASADRNGIYFGTWGLQRKPEGNNDPRTWDKYDGAVYGLGFEGNPLWGDGRADLDPVPRCYELEGRERDGNDLLWCGLLNAYHVSFYNGTVEGQPAIDTARGAMYAGRGDGKLYALDPATGEILWRFRTFNPQFPEDPDGGGEVVTSPLYDAAGTVYFATWGEGAYETNAIYAVNPDGSLRWRYPSATSLSHRFFASPALSPDGSTLYFSTFTDRDSIGRAGTIYAFHRLDDQGASGEERLKWSMELALEGDPVIANTMAVGTDGTLYVGGSVLRNDVNVPVLIAVRDNGGSPSVGWGGEPVEFQDNAQFVLGIALRETGGNTERLYVTTSNSGAPVFNWKTEGRLYAVEPETGAILASYDPSDDVATAVGGMNSPAVDAAGRIYVGVRGHYRGPFAPERAPGYYIGLRYDEAARRFGLLWSLQTDDNYVEWTHPAIGPDGGIYAGSAAHGPLDSVYAAVHPPGAVPPETSPKFYGIRGGTSRVKEGSSGERTELAEPEPNPVSGTTLLRFRLERPSVVRLAIVDLLGRPVAEPANGYLEGGEHSRPFDAEGLAPGLYFVRLDVRGDLFLRKIAVR